VDFFSARNNFSGWYNPPNYPNHYAFAALKADGSITAWGNPDAGGIAPSGSGYLAHQHEQKIDSLAS
jgi:hypothetical protein